MATAADIAPMLEDLYERLLETSPFLRPLRPTTSLIQGRIVCTIARVHADVRAAEGPTARTKNFDPGVIIVAIMVPRMLMVRSGIASTILGSIIMTAAVVVTFEWDRMQLRTLYRGRALNMCNMYYNPPTSPTL